MKRIPVLLLLLTITIKGFSLNDRIRLGLQFSPGVAWSKPFGKDLEKGKPRFGVNYGFVIEYFEHVPVTDQEKYLDGTRDGILKSLKGTLVSESKLSLDGHPGRELSMSLTAENGTVVLSRTRFYLVGNTMFSLSYVWRKDLDQTLANKTGERFFSSVRLKSKQ